MSLITRQDKGSKLTIQEMDGNLLHLDFNKKFETATDAVSGDIAHLLPNGKVAALGRGALAADDGIVIDMLALPDGDILYLLVEGNIEQNLIAVRLNSEAGEVYRTTLIPGIDIGESVVFRGLKLTRDPDSGLILFFMPGAVCFIDLDTGSVFNTDLTMDGSGLYAGSAAFRNGVMYFSSIHYDEMTQLMSQRIFAANITVERDGGSDQIMGVSISIISYVVYENNSSYYPVKLVYSTKADKVLVIPFAFERFDQAPNNIVWAELNGGTLILNLTGLDLGNKKILDFTQITLGNREFAVAYLGEMDGEDLSFSFSILEVSASTVVELSNTPTTRFFLTSSLEGVNNTSTIVEDTVIFSGFTTDGYESSYKDFMVAALFIKLNPNGSLNAFNFSDFIKYDDGGTGSRDIVLLRTAASRIVYSVDFGYVYNYHGFDLDADSFNYKVVELTRNELVFDLTLVDPADSWKKVIGFYKTDAVKSGQVDIKMFGILQNSDFDLTPGVDYYLDKDNTLTDLFTLFESYETIETGFDYYLGYTYVSTGWGIRLGRALSSDTLLVNISKEFGIDEAADEYYYYY